HLEAVAAKERDRLYRAASTVQDVVQQDDWSAAIYRSLDQSPATMRLPLLANESASKWLSAIRRQHGANHRISAESESCDLIDPSRLESLCQDGSYFVEHAAVQHGDARIQQPADRLASRIGDVLLFPPHQRLLVQTAAKFDQVRAGGGGEGRAIHARAKWNPIRLHRHRHVGPERRINTCIS